jgi:hypothetical protein
MAESLVRSACVQVLLLVEPQRVFADVRLLLQATLAALNPVALPRLEHDSLQLVSPKSAPLTPALAATRVQALGALAVYIWQLWSERSDRAAA